MRARISKRSVDGLICPEGTDRIFLWDDAVAGFGVAAFPTGKKAYVVQYRQNGRSRRATIGDHGRLTPDQARSQAKKILGFVESGADPIADRQAARAVRTFGEVAEEFLRAHASTKRKARTADEYERVLRLHVLPSIGLRRMFEVNRSDVAKLHAKMAETPAVANKMLAIISSLWNWAARQDEVVVNSNPAVGIERYHIQGRERFLSAHELARLGEALRTAETIGLPYDIDEKNPKAKHAPKIENRITPIDPFAVAAIRLLLFTGARVSEIRTAQWSFVDFERYLLNLPDSKTGKKSIFLNSSALEILRSLPRIRNNPFIIANPTRAGPRADLKRPWDRIRKAAGLDGVRLHDLRHSFASIGAGAGLGLPIVGKLLGHTQPSTTNRYAHLDADPLLRAANHIGDAIASALDRCDKKA